MPLSLRPTLLSFSSPRALRYGSSSLILIALLVAGCVTSPTPPSAPEGPPPGPYTPSTPAAPIPPANVNLQGFPPEYRQGYVDGCASASGAERKDAARFKSDGQYRTGWQDGNALCRKP